MDTLFVPLSLAAGGMLAVQAGANAQLARAVASPAAATTLQLAMAAVILAVIALFTGNLAALLTPLPADWWHWIGGTASAFYVVSTILLFPRLGAVVSVGLFIAGQMLTSLALDGFGLLGVPASGFSPQAALGTGLVLGGAALIVLGQERAGLDRAKLAWVALALAAGAVLPVQGAVNALLRHDLAGAAFAVGTVSFVVATLAMAAVLAVALLIPGAPRPRLAGLPAAPWWAWLGGFAGATYVTTMFTAIPEIGAATTVGLTVGGQQIASLFVDRFGWFRLPRRSISALRLVGVMLLLAGVAVIKLA